MKKVRFRSLVVMIMALMFLGGIGFFLFEYATCSGEWAINSINGHTSGNGLSTAGRILDRNDVVLAQSINGNRVYSDNKDVRKALLHVVGDEHNYISTSIQCRYSAELMGYNIITGYGLPKSLGLSRDIKLTLDSELCKLAYQKLSGHKGSVAVYNYKTGEIVCIASTPTYDINNPPKELNSKDEYDGVYLNRAFSSSFTPGSSFKIITAIAAIDNIDGLESKKFYCPGHLEVDGKKITCLGRHGNIGIKEAMARSCNVAFAEMAMEMGADKMLSKALELGFNEGMNVDKIPIEKSQYTVDNISRVDLGWSGIGQYKDLINPVHILTVLGAIANQGVSVQPYIVDSISSPFLPSFGEKSAKTRKILSAETANKVKELMRYAVKSNYGDYRFKNIEVGAKTGTGEVGENKKPNSCVVGFSVTESCPLAFVVIVENGGFGISTAMPIASAVMNMAAKRI